MDSGDVKTLAVAHNKQEAAASAEARRAGGVSPLIIRMEWYHCGFAEAPYVNVD